MTGIVDPSPTHMAEAQAIRAEFAPLIDSATRELADASGWRSKFAARRRLQRLRQDRAKRLMLAGVLADTTGL
jgi:hypothetical protein